MEPTSHTKPSTTSATILTARERSISSAAILSSLGVTTLNDKQATSGERSEQKPVTNVADLSEASKPVNRQLYANSGLASLFNEGNGDAVPASPAAGFFNQRLPNLAILHEKPEHRVLLLLKLRGMSNREIARETGYTEPWLSQLFRQPWATAVMAKISTESGVDCLKQLLASEAVPSIMRLVELRDDPDVPATVARSACDSLLDRYLGKPTQHVDVVSTSAPVNAESIAEVNKELEDLKAEERALMGHN